jgi:predicted Zn-dependent protease
MALHSGSGCPILLNRARVKRQLHRNPAGNAQLFRYATVVMECFMKSRSLLVALCLGCTCAVPSTQSASAQSGTRTISQSAVQQAAQQHPNIVSEFGGNADPRLTAYVNRVGQRVAVQTRTGPYTFTTLNSPVLNAFAVPGGYIYVTRDLVALANDEAELASVLGHEMAHVAAKHSKERNSRNIFSQIGAILVATVTGSQQIGQLVSQVGQGLLLSFSRSQENEADALGVRYISAAGYDPAASPRFLASLGAASSLDDRLNGRDQRAIPSWARTHPLSQDRVKRTTALVAKQPRAATAERNRDQFLSLIDGMLYGDDPKQGIIEGNQFLHPVMRLKFTAPQGYAMQNGASAVTISGTAGQAQFSGGRYSGNLSSYIGQVFQQVVGNQARVSYPTPRTTTVNGRPAAYSTARVQTQQGQVDLSVFAYQWDSGTAYHFVTMTRAGAGFGPFGSMVGSLTPMSASEASAIRPRVIDVVTVRSGDTVQSLAGRMAYRDYALERFRVLNALSANSQLTPGQKVKLVVYGG